VARREAALLTIDPKQWDRFARDLDAFDPGLKRGLRKRLKNAGESARNAVIDALHEAPPSGGGSPAGSREAIAAATRVAVSFSRTNAGVRVISSAKNLSEEHQWFLHSYNLERFRHPVFGLPNVWVEQAGRPFFGKVIAKAVSKDDFKEMRAALDDAAKAIGARAR
jgi:hypothetical protein